MERVPPETKKKEDWLGLIYWVTTLHAMCVLPFLRSGFGREALGVPGFLAFILLLSCALASPVCAGFFLTWLGMVIYRRVETFRLLRQGAQLHSRYAGYPSLALRVPFVRTVETATGFWEPALAFLGGLMLCPLAEGFGGFIMLAGFSLMVRNGIEGEITRKRIERMQDAKIEGEFYSSRLN